MNPEKRLLRFPRSIRHAITAMGYLATRGGEVFHLVEEVARKTGLPQCSLAKTLQRLARQGFLLSRRGRQGGYRLARDPATVSMAELLAAAREDTDCGDCMLEARVCDRDTPCIFHPAVEESERILRETLERTRLTDLIRPAEAGEQSS